MRENHGMVAKRTVSARNPAQMGSHGRGRGYSPASMTLTGWSDKGGIRARGHWGDGTLRPDPRAGQAAWYPTDESAKNGQPAFTSGCEGVLRSQKSVLAPNELTRSIENIIEVRLMPRSRGGGGPRGGGVYQYCRFRSQNGCAHDSSSGDRHVSLVGLPVTVVIKILASRLLAIGAQRQQAQETASVMSAPKVVQMRKREITRRAPTQNSTNGRRGDSARRGDSGGLRSLTVAVPWGLLWLRLEIRPAPGPG